MLFQALTAATSATATETHMEEEEGCVRAAAALKRQQYRAARQQARFIKRAAATVENCTTLLKRQRSPKLKKNLIIYYPIPSFLFYFQPTYPGPFDRIGAKSGSIKTPLNFDYYTQCTSKKKYLTNATGNCHVFHSPILVRLL